MCAARRCIATTRAAEILELLRRTRATAFIGQAGYGADADRRDIFAELGGIETLKHVYRLEPPKRVALRHGRACPGHPRLCGA